MDKNEEIILVAERQHIFEGEALTWQGATNNINTINRVLENLHFNVETMKRGLAENDETYKQPIPYMILKRGSEVFVYERLQGGGESRLHNKLSLGVGGHMNHLSDESFKHDVLLNTMRELDEEVEIIGYDVTEKDLMIATLINDDEDEVGRVHIGLLGVIELPETAEVVVKEQDQLLGSWSSISELKENADMFNRLENWSKIFIESL